METDVYLDSQMQIGQVVLFPVDPPLGIVFSLAETLCPGRVRNNTPYPDQVLNQSTELSQMLHRR
ncbi:hypothetical protein Hanom_Chr04g00301151 [Helianthus anomalus]